MKLIYANYNSEDGSSVVKINHLGLIFFGEARLHPDDTEKASRFAGCEIAEIRAKVKALKYERKLAIEDWKNIKKFINTCSQSKNWDKTSYTAKVAYHQLNVKLKRINMLTDEINNYLEEINIKIKQRDIITNAITRKKQKVKVD